MLEAAVLAAKYWGVVMGAFGFWWVLLLVLIVLILIAVVF
jgi:hypothetical protein